MKGVLIINIFEGRTQKNNNNFVSNKMRGENEMQLNLLKHAAYAFISIMIGLYTL